MSVELSKEMLVVKGYLGDARVLVEEQVGKGVSPDIQSRLILEVARMLQLERQHHHHKKPKPDAIHPEKSQPVSVKRVSSDSIMTRARKHPNLPPMVSADDVPTPAVEFTTRRTKPLSRVRASDVPRGLDPDDVAKPRRPRSRRASDAVEGVRPPRKASPKPKRAASKKTTRRR